MKLQLIAKLQLEASTHNPTLCHCCARLWLGVQLDAEMRAVEETVAEMDAATATAVSSGASTEEMIELKVCIVLSPRFLS